MIIRGGEYPFPMESSPFSVTHRSSCKVMFIKLFTHILDSSIADNRPLRHFFTDLLLCADAKGFVMMTESAIARRVGCTLEEAKWGLAELMKPDPMSKTPDNAGARIERLDGMGYGWRITNYEAYRAVKDADQMREATKERVRRFREKVKNETKGNASVTPGNAITEADTKAEAEADLLLKKEAKPAAQAPAASKKPESKKEEPSSRHQEMMKVVFESYREIQGHDFTMPGRFPRQLQTFLKSWNGDPKEFGAVFREVLTAVRDKPFQSKQIKDAVDPGSLCQNYAMVKALLRAPSPESTRFGRPEDKVSHTDREHGFDF